MNILRLIASDSYITVNKELIKHIGLEGAVLVGELASEYDYWSKNDGITPEGYFFSTIENIEEKTGLSEHRQRQAIKKLEGLSIIDVKVKGLPAKRYVKLNEESILKLFETRSEILKHQVSEISETVPLKIQELAPEKFKRNNNINNNNINNNNITIINNGETSSPSESTETTPIESIEDKNINNDAPPTPPPVEKPKRQSLKDQLVEYVNSTQFTAETKEVLFKWIFNIGLPKNVRLEQLRDMLKKIWTDCHENETLVRESIEQAYLHNWFGFYPPKVSKPTSVYNPPAQPLQTPCTPVQKEPHQVGCFTVY